nr:unnamed protein product [Digitaria exilis]
MASLAGTSTGRGSSQSGGRPTSTAAAAAPKQLLSKLRSTWRRGVARPRPVAAVRFGYDLHSYSQNFDDGLSSSGHRLSVSL